MSFPSIHKGFTFYNTILNTQVKFNSAVEGQFKNGSNNYANSDCWCIEAVDQWSCRSMRFLLSEKWSQWRHRLSTFTWDTRKPDDLLVLICLADWSVESILDFALLFRMRCWLFRLLGWGVLQCQARCHLELFWDRNASLVRLSCRPETWWSSTWWRPR